MAKYSHTILGIRPVNFKAENGDSVNGFQFFLGVPSERGVGMEVEKAWIKPQLMASLTASGATMSDMVNRSALPVYNRFGKVDHLIIEGLD